MSAPIAWPVTPASDHDEPSDDLLAWVRANDRADETADRQPVAWEPLGYERYRRWTHSLDRAWRRDGDKSRHRSRVKPKLCDGDPVKLTQDTMGGGSRYYCLVPEESVGVVVVARTPNVTGNEGYFANVDILHDGCRFRVRVPHDALRRLPSPSGASDAHCKRKGA